jgi:hypothetical protein
MTILPENQGVAIFHPHAFIGNKHLDKCSITGIRYEPTNTFGTLTECLCHCISRGGSESAFTLVYDDKPAFDCLGFEKLFVAPKMKQ